MMIILDSNILKRIISALFIGSIFLFSIFGPKYLFEILMSLVAGCMFYEWYNLTKDNNLNLSIGVFFISISIISLILIKNQNNGSLLVFLFFSIIWSVDIFAMIGGKIVGGYKLAPKLSPNKTWSGFIIGILSSVLVAIILNLIFDFITIFYDLFYDINYLLFVLSVAILAQAGDLFESYFKRIKNVKDSGSIIPGHGGVLDRFDSILLSSPFFFGIITLTQYLN